MDKPIPVQCAVFLGRALRGDLGNSLFFQQPAIEVLMERMPATLQLSAAALLFSLSVAIPVGLLSALKRDTFWDYLGIRVGHDRPGDPTVLAGYYAHSRLFGWIGLATHLWAWHTLSSGVAGYHPGLGAHGADHAAGALGHVGCPERRLCPDGAPRVCANGR
ncbi:MAG: hypothetical protein R2932_21055 [Caldilineaceae bacterium]